MPDFFASQANFTPDASQSFGNEFHRWAASQNLVKGTPEYKKQETTAASQCIREDYFTPRGRARLERLRRQREYERLEVEQSIEAVKEEEDDAAWEDDVPELKDEDDESVVSLDVGFSQAFTYDPYLGRTNSENDEGLGYPLELAGDEMDPDLCDIKEESPHNDDLKIDLLPLIDDIDTKSVVSMDQGLAQAFVPSNACNDNTIVPDKEPGVAK